MDFNNYTLHQLRELAGSIMQFKFFPPVEGAVYSKMVNELLRKIKEHVSDCSPSDVECERLLAIFDQFADDRWIRTILHDLETEHYWRGQWTHESIRDELSAALFPTTIRASQWEWIEPELQRIVSNH